MVDYDEVLEPAKSYRPKLIICGGSAYPRTVDTAEFRKIADEVDALLMGDMAHFSGLVAAGLHPNPVEHCDIVTSTTNKKPAGPRAGSVPAARSTRRLSTAPSFPGCRAARRARIAQRRRPSRSPLPRRSAHQQEQVRRTPMHSPTS